MEKADESLLPCPWCRGHNLSVGFSDGVGNISVHCFDCGMSGPSSTIIHRAKEEWNNLPRRMLDTNEESLRRLGIDAPCEDFSALLGAIANATGNMCPMVFGTGNCHYMTKDKRCKVVGCVRIRSQCWANALPKILDHICTPYRKLDKYNLDIRLQNCPICGETSGLGYMQSPNCTFVKCGYCGYEGPEASRHLRDDVQLLYDAVLLWNAHVLDKKSPDDKEVANGKN